MNEFPLSWSAMLRAAVLATFLIGCEARHPPALEITVSIQSKRMDGSATIYDYGQDLAYQMNGKPLGDNNRGAEALLASLREIRGNRSVELTAPPRFIGGTGQAVVLCSEDLAPYVKDPKIAELIRRELNRIRANG